MIIHIAFIHTYSVDMACMWMNSQSYALQCTAPDCCCPSLEHGSRSIPLHISMAFIWARSRHIQQMRLEFLAFLLSSNENDDGKSKIAGDSILIAFGRSAIFLVAPLDRWFFESEKFDFVLLFVVSSLFPNFGHSSLLFVSLFHIAHVLFCLFSPIFFAFFSIFSVFIVFFLQKLRFHQFHLFSFSLTATPPPEHLPPHFSSKSLGI